MNGTHEIMKAAIRECLDAIAGRERNVEVALKKAADRLTHPMQVAIIGRISSSKSSLVNALLKDESVAATDKAEETFNVSLVKYGTDKEDITVVTRDGTRLRASRQNLRDWSGREGKFAANPDISHIEIQADNPLLKTASIIDTPGLDSSYGLDSENTVRFLQQARPDAILMLFTKSINSDTLETLREFQDRLCTDDYAVSPMNAIGVMAKTDEFWKITEADLSPRERGNRVIHSLIEFHPGLLHTFLNIYPISALTALAANRIDDEDTDLLRKLAGLTPQQKIITFASANGFLTEIPGIDLSAVQRKKLLDRLGLFGAWAAADLLEREPGASLEDIRNLLSEESGLPRLKEVVISHFGRRASIIKTRNAVSEVIHAISKARVETSDPSLALTLDNIAARLDEALSSIREYDVWDLLSRVYEKQIVLSDPQAVADLKALAGENGYSATEKLGMTGNPAPHQLMEKAKEKSLAWARKYIFYRMRRRREPAFVYRVLAHSFSVLAREIEASMRKIEESQRIILACKRFLYPNESKCQN